MEKMGQRDELHQINIVCRSEKFRNYRKEMRKNGALSANDLTPILSKEFHPRMNRRQFTMIPQNTYTKYILNRIHFKEV